MIAKVNQIKHLKVLRLTVVKRTPLNLQMHKMMLTKLQILLHLNLISQVKTQGESIEISKPLYSLQWNTVSDSKN